MSASQEMDRPLDLGRLLATLADHGVEYIVIGGVATQVHGHRRTTMDLDLTPGPDAENLARLAAALGDLEARLQDPALSQSRVSIADPERLAIAAIVPPLATRHGQLHILKEPKGARDFEQMREDALVIELDGIEVAIASLDDLIRMKRAAGRRSDLDDIAALIEAEKQQRD